jgi:hypothetical protein
VLKSQEQVFGRSRPYSCRSATIGCVRLARHAGHAHASRPAASSTPDAPANEAGSNVETLQICRASSLAANALPARPAEG